MDKPLTHFDSQGQAHVVDVGAKPFTHRAAVASGRIRMRSSTLALIQQGSAAKGDVLSVARIAGIMAAKKTAGLIPLCHPIPLTRVAVSFEVAQADGTDGEVLCIGEAETVGPTGVEMEALTATSVALLTIYDMCKAADRSMCIGQIRLEEKRGGKSGTYIRG